MSGPGAQSPREDASGPGPPALRAFRAPYDYYHDRYQDYYLEGIRSHLARVAGRVFRPDRPARARLLRALRTIRHSHRVGGLLGGKAGLLHRGIDRVAGGLGRAGAGHPGAFHPLVGQYLLHQGDDVVRFCVDSQDSGEIGSPELLEWSDCYFKTNFWRDAGYPPKVIPLANGNPRILGRIAELEALRDQPEAYDLAFVVRVWGGKDEVEGIEHNLRLIEEVSKVDCRKYLLAYLVAGDIGASARRLEARGIPWTTSPMRLEELWKVSAASRLVVIRLGMHHCIPWRMMDTLAMGSYAVLDQMPRTAWNAGLDRDEHFLSLDIRDGLLGPIASDGDYRAIPAKMAGFLEDEARIRRVRSAGAQLFDRHVGPEALGRHIVETALARRGVGVGT